MNNVISVFRTRIAVLMDLDWKTDKGNRKRKRRYYHRLGTGRRGSCRASCTCSYGDTCDSGTDRARCRRDPGADAACAGSDDRSSWPCRDKVCILCEAWCRRRDGGAAGPWNFGTSYCNGSTNAGVPVLPLVAEVSELVAPAPRTAAYPTSFFQSCAGS